MQEAMNAVGTEVLQSLCSPADVIHHVSTGLTAHLARQFLLPVIKFSTQQATVSVHPYTQSALAFLSMKALLGLQTESFPRLLQA